jgi:hypothetical protein
MEGGTVKHRTETIGDCTLILGDCLQVMPTLGRVDAVVTDPPYGNSNHDGDWNARLNEHRGIESKPIANDDAEGMRRVVDAALTAAVPLMAGKVSACCCFCGGGGAAAGVRLAGRTDGSEGVAVLSFGHLGQEKPRPRPALQAAA